MRDSTASGQALSRLCLALEVRRSYFVKGFRALRGFRQATRRCPTRLGSRPERRKHLAQRLVSPSLSSQHPTYLNGTTTSSS
jgi:hypothetical protein